MDVCERGEDSIRNHPPPPTLLPVLPPFSSQGDDNAEDIDSSFAIKYPCTSWSSSTKRNKPSSFAIDATALFPEAAPRPSALHHGQLQDQGGSQPKPGGVKEGRGVLPPLQMQQQQHHPKGRCYGGWTDGRERGREGGRKGH